MSVVGCTLATAARVPPRCDSVTALSVRSEKRGPTSHVAVHDVASEPWSERRATTSDVAPLTSRCADHSAAFASAMGVGSCDLRWSYTTAVELATETHMIGLH